MAPAKPARPAPNENVTAYICDVDIPEARASSGFSKAALTRNPKLVFCNK